MVAVAGGGDAEDFFDGGFATEYFLEAVATHGDVTVLDGLFVKLGRMRAAVDEVLQRVSHEADLIDGESALEAAASAGLATHSAHDLAGEMRRKADRLEIALLHLRGCFAYWAEFAHQTLGKEGTDSA